MFSSAVTLPRGKVFVTPAISTTVCSFWFM
jgi:hypothetical protein